MAARHATELLYDSEAALRLVDSAIEDLRDARPRARAMSAEILARGYADIVGALGRLRESHDLLEKTTAAAATDIREGIDRAIALVSELNARAAAAEAAAGDELRNRLRDELFALADCIESRDITAQQLTQASTILREMEARLAELAPTLAQ